ncbi:polysaccharide biosynthesis tyrosine autokinase [Kangiella sediminilitoris]|uniref:Tyrosine-protein kinase Wzc n=1 Tax=Kangiella sediminilitoris TaxID=1144748 RepID=A0A1B3BBK5_9GAMM|nr:polysaccharide biosynthesis tyrosine autokinase [Kangiella sediminilitoris]AOE50175.1 Tyrosine-protein kinase Wzc [Kangiella sediminilitoris]
MKFEKHNGLNKQGSVQADDEIDLRELFNHLWQGRWLILVTVFVCALISLIYAISALPVYQANNLLQIEEKQSGISDLVGMPEYFMEESDSSTEIELIKSRRIIGKTVDQMSLDIKVSPSKPPFAAGIAYSGVSNFITDFAFYLKPSAVKHGEVLEVSILEVPGSYLDTRLTLRAAGKDSYELFYENELLLEGHVGETVETGGFSIHIKSLSAHPGAEFFVVKQNRLRAVNELQEEITVIEKGDKSGILEMRLKGTDSDLLPKVLDQVAQNYVLENVNRSSAEASKSLKFLRNQLPEIRAGLEENEEKLNQYQVSAESVNILAETQVLLEQSVELESKISELKLKKSEVERKFQPSHPVYKSVNSQISELTNKKVELRNRILGLPDTQQELLRLKRNVEVGTAIYTQMLNSIQELNIVRAGTVGNVRVVDTAATALEPIKPKKALILALGMLLGGIIGVLIALVRTFLSKGLNSPEEIENMGKPVYAVVPFSKFQDGMKVNVLRGTKKKVTFSDGLLAIENPADNAIESLRGLRTSIYFAMVESDSNAIMITSPGPGAGKSFNSSNLAILMAQAGKKVVLIDADLRKGYLHRLFKLKTKQGISDFLRGQIGKESLINNTEVDALKVIPRGAVPPNPSELLMSTKFEHLLSELKQQFDLVIIDTPPVLAVTDARVVSKQVGTVLMVVRHNVTHKKELEIALKTFANTQSEVKGVVFNGFTKKSAEYSYYSYEYE